MLGFIGSLIAALLSWWRGRDRQKEEQEHVVEAYRDEANGMAEPVRPWPDTLDRL